MGILNDHLAELDAAIRAAGADAGYDGLTSNGDDEILVVYTDGKLKEPPRGVQLVIDNFTPAVRETPGEIIDGMGLADSDKVALKRLLGA
jgi:hypothetical protein